MGRCLAITLLSLLVATAARAENFTATFYPQGKHDRVLFTQTQTEEKTGDTVTGARRVIRAQDGSEAVVETVTYADGKVQRYTIDQKQVNEQGTLEIADGRLTFSYTADGKTKTDSERVSPDLVIAPTVVAFLHANWERLMGGTVLKARLAVLDRRETVGFQFTKIGEAVRQGKPVVLVQMKPSSFIIAALVKDIRMTFDTTSRQLVEFSGRVLAKQKDGNSWDTLDADVVYQY